jgi:hypothetical protein
MFSMNLNKPVLVLTFLLTTLGNSVAQNFNSQKLYDTFEKYKESKIFNKRFSHDEIVPYFKKFESNSIFRFSEIGTSLEGREIQMISFGTGPVNVLAWTQMHGDESTATMALVDILNFFNSDDEFNEMREEILSNLTINLIPMLNPDGAERYRRRNALNIDLNRDALRLQFPESIALKSARDSLNADFGFNLHDQSTRYTVGYSYKSAAISFLAPAYNYEKDINDVRANTMKLIVNIHDELSRFIPGHMARYDDEFEPRAFGDNFVKWGTSSVLIESGGWKNNYEKQFIRKMNFIALLVGFQSIAGKQYEAADIQDYFKIPENKTRLFDLLLRNLSVEYEGSKYKIDIGINHHESDTKDYRDDYFRGTIDDVGDLSTYYGYDEFDLEGMTISPGKIFDEEFTSVDDLAEVDFANLHKEGYTYLKLLDIPEDLHSVPFPMDIVANDEEDEPEFGENRAANFTIHKDGKIRFVVINGFIVDLVSGKGAVLNGIIK